eukprot:g12442.t1
MKMMNTLKKTIFAHVYQSRFQILTKFVDHESRYCCKSLRLLLGVFFKLNTITRRTGPRFSTIAAKTLLGVDVLEVDPWALHQRDMRFAYTTSTRSPNATTTAAAEVVGTTSRRSTPLQINARDRFSGKTALHLAVEKEAIAILDLLLSHPFVDVHVVDYCGNTALMTALAMPVTCAEKDRIINTLKRSAESAEVVGGKERPSGGHEVPNLRLFSSG